jgi:tRNA U34 5-methylaminomethyl-2-thiouridine-forming methyltransferase MnmC
MISFLYLAMLQLVKTDDGSNTLFNSEVGEHYHSRHGALQESKHVFLSSGLQYYLSKKPSTEVSILEVGFGTGLNFLITADFCTENQLFLNYTGIEAYPLSADLIRQTGYDDYISLEIWTGFHSHYQETLLNSFSINQHCKLHVAKCKLLEFQTDQKFDVLYFDAFASIHQPEMWTDESLAHVCQFLKPGGVFVTYAITGNLKRSMKSLGFSVEKAPGAPGKREMLRSVKLD